jgi:hypothetical protein
LPKLPKFVIAKIEDRWLGSLEFWQLSILAIPAIQVLPGYLGYFGIGPQFMYGT